MPFLSDPSSGDSGSWAYDTLQVKYVFSLEFRPEAIGYNPRLFCLPEDVITPNAQEVFAGVQSVLDQLSSESPGAAPAVEALSGGLSTQIMASIITIVVILIPASIRFIL